MTLRSKRKAVSEHGATQRWHDAADPAAAAEPTAPLDAPTAEGAPTEPPPPPDLPADAVPVVQCFSINGHWQNIKGFAIPPPHALPPCHESPDAGPSDLTTATPPPGPMRKYKAAQHAANH